MRRVFYIIAPTSSGKTTSSIKLSQEMGLPLYHADNIFNMLAETYPVNCLPAKLTQFELWGDPSNFGLSSWGAHPNMDGAKQEKYFELLKDEEGDFIIEGFTLGFVSERNMITNVVGPHEAFILRIDLSFEDWVGFFKRKFGENKLPTKESFLRLTKTFQQISTDKIYTVSHPSQVSSDLFLLEKHDETYLRNEKSMKLMTEATFMAKAQNWLESNPLDKNGNVVGYWKDAKDRWTYFSRISEILQKSSPDGGLVLELGSMGLPVVEDSHLMDYDRHLSYYEAGKPDYIMDVRNLPWPIESKSYDWFIALRVFHHLWPVQRECFEEARRIAKNIVLVVPEKLPPDGGVVILPEDFREWNNDVRPDIIEPAGRFGYIYVWLEK